MPRSLPLVLMALSLSERGALAAPLLSHDVRIFDGTAVSQAEVLVDKGVIRAVGKTLLPGLIDSHTHAY